MDLAYDDPEDQHIESESDEDDEQDAARGRRRNEPSSDVESDDDRKETLQEKRVRMAREYLEKIDGGHSDASSTASTGAESDDDDNDDNDKDPHNRIGRKLQRERQKQEGKYERVLADKVADQVRSLTSKALASSTIPHPQSQSFVHSLRGHDLTPTCVAMVGEDKAISGSKDHSVLLWDLEQQCTLATLCPQWKKDATASTSKKTSSSVARTAGQVLCVAASDDGRYAAVGKRDATVSIFDLRSRPIPISPVNTFDGHKGPVTCLTFRAQSHQLFSGSSDRCIRHYSLDEMLYMETLYGHQFGVTDLDCDRLERPISVGQDRTARAWKLAEDSHLIFRGGARLQAADCVSVLKDDWFLTGHQDGHVALWMTDKKKAVASMDHAHGIEHGLGRGICSVASLRLSDLAATGSFDGWLRLWKVQTGRALEERGLREVAQVAIPGYINSIAFGPKAAFCLVAVGQEHRLGRWNRISKAKNRIAIVKLRDPDFVYHSTEANPKRSEEEPEQDSDAMSDDGGDTSPSSSASPFLQEDDERN